MVAVSNPLLVAEVRLAPTFAHIVAFSITYELVSAMCATSFTGALFLLGPAFVLVAVFGEAESILSGAICTGPLVHTVLYALVWLLKLAVQVSMLITANLVARLVTDAIHKMPPVYAAAFVSYILVLGYIAGRASGAIM